MEKTYRWQKATADNLPKDGSEIIFLYKGFKHIGWLDSLGIGSEFIGTASGISAHYSEIEILSEVEQPARISWWRR